LGLATIVWSRAAGDLGILEGNPAGWLLGVIDADGLQAEFIDRFPAFDWANATESERLTRPANEGKPVSRHIAETQARAAALALLAHHRTHRNHFEWLLVVAADDENDVAYRATIEREPGGQPMIGPRDEWKWTRPAPFEERDVPEWLTPVRTSMLRVLREGLHDAALRRGRETRRQHRRNV
jgi:hypothetical protein